MEVIWRVEEVERKRWSNNKGLKEGRCEEGEVEKEQSEEEVRSERNNGGYGG